MPDLLLILTTALIVFAMWPGQPNRVVWLLRLLTLLLLSPLLRYVETVFGFAVRLRLSDWAGQMLRGVGVPVQTEGNLLILHGQEMAVDPACMGLRMTGLTLLLAVFWLLAYERRQLRTLATGWVLTYGFVALTLTILSNLIRIVFLVLFNLGPDHPLHELVGLCCVLVYAWLPLWWLARWLLTRYGQPDKLQERLARVINWKTGMALLFVGTFCVAFIRPSSQRYPVPPRAGYVRQVTLFDFVQYSRPGQLIYVKPLPDWYSAEHSPAVCWKGQGYTLRQVHEVTVAGQRVYRGELRKGHQRLQTAWWFTNGQHRSIGQLDVRSRMLRGEPVFALINVTVADPGTLPAAVKAWQRGF
ncbi:exosortase N [Fibrella aquatica]|uniref:exosortase N n=1 Tax=Fibrella aquatica TaxID=3242487 RepID=UPI0035217625